MANGIPKVLEKYIKDSKVIIDLGINKGREIRGFLKITPNAEIHAFEPHAGWFKRTRDKFKKYPNCHFYELAVSNEDGTSELYIGNHKGGHTLIESTELHEVLYDSSVSVKTCRLDTWYKKSKIDKIDFLWSDIEGSEKNMILGGRKTLKNVKYFYTEYSTQEFYKGQALLDEIIDMLKDSFDVVEIFDREFDGGGDVLFRNKKYEKNTI